MAEIYLPDGTKLSDYLLRSAGVSMPLTGDLWIDKAGPAIELLGATYGVEIKNNAGDFQVSVAAGKKFKFVVLP